MHKNIALCYDACVDAVPLAAFSVLGPPPGPRPQRAAGGGGLRFKRRVVSRGRKCPRLAGTFCSLPSCRGCKRHHVQRDDYFAG